jgi:hypothetical protein
MTRIFSLCLAGALAAAVLAGAAAAAYTTPTLTVTSAGTQTSLVVRQAQTDDATAKATIYAPAGTPVTLSQAPGATLGTVQAQVTALALGGALLPLTGQIQVAPAGQVPAAQQIACTGTATHGATWLMVLQAAGQTLNVPMYVDTTTGAEAAFAAAKIQVCLPPPDIPADQGGATFGAKLFNASFTLTGVFGSRAGTWRTLWTPYVAGNGQVNAAGSVESRATVAAGAATLRATRSGARVRVTGRVTAGGRSIAGAVVQIWGGARRTALRRIATVGANAAGNYSLARTRGTLAWFQARTTVAARADSGGCAAPGPLPVQCVNATLSGFAARSAVSRIR